MDGDGMSYSTSGSEGSDTCMMATSTNGGNGGNGGTCVGDGEHVHHHHIASGFVTEGMGTTITTITKRSQDNSSPATIGTSELKEPREDPEEEAIKLPQSTHSLLFTEKICSLPFFFSFLIISLSYTCLILALVGNIQEGNDVNKYNVPYNVSSTVRVAQYLSIVIALIMEEEIPTALYLLRMIPKKSLHRKFPYMKFGRFVLSAVIRLISGYLFLVNTYYVVVQADAVLEIFYDVLAIQFLQQLDDIAFSLAKIDVFGKTLKKACTAKCFRTEFERVPFLFRKKMSIFLKAVYFINLCCLLVALTFVSVRQATGYYHCDSITVTFGDDIWEDAIAMTRSGEIVTRVLLFSYFNGVYIRNGTHDGRPMYTELNKFNNSPFDGSATVGAEIKYCAREGSWVFSHPFIRKNMNEKDLDCPWLLKSPRTEDYNLLDVDGDWNIWTGIIQKDGQVSVTCNTCNDEIDCNYHGQCVEEKCVCSEMEYFGNHCEHEIPCGLISGVDTMWELSVQNDGSVLRLYDRPVYKYIGGSNETALAAIGITDPKIDYFDLIYTGSRWFATVHKNAGLTPQSEIIHYVNNFHAFWMNAYTNLTHFVSDPSTESSPIAVDFYEVGKQGEEFGPFGELFPLRYPPGSGYFRCEDRNETAAAIALFLKGGLT